MIFGCSVFPIAFSSFSDIRLISLCPEDGVTTQLVVEQNMKKKIKKIKNLFFIILMILYTDLYSQFKFFMRMFFKPQIIFFIVFLSFAEIDAFEKKGRLSVGGGIHNFMQNGILRCEGRGGCDTTKPNNPAPINYKQRSTVYSVEYFFSKPVLRVLKPYIGFNGTNKDAYYGYFGFSAGNVNALL